MRTIGVIGKNEMETCEEISNLINIQADLFCLSENVPAKKLDILIINEVSPDLEKFISLLDDKKVVIVNSDDKEIFRQLNSHKLMLMTYGFNSKACLTTSSVQEDEISVCVQREITSLAGNKWENQEFPIRIKEEMGNVNSVLAAVCAAILLY